jgi:hypothetical protein
MRVASLEVWKTSDLSSDYEPSFQSAQRDDRRLSQRSDLREPDLNGLGQTNGASTKKICASPSSVPSGERTRTSSPHS